MCADGWRWLVRARWLAIRRRVWLWRCTLTRNNRNLGSIIDDVEFWCRYGGHIEANLESAGLHLYPARDRELLAELIVDKRWSNEGLFALITDPTKAPMLYTHLSPSSD